MKTIKEINQKVLKINSINKRIKSIEKISNQIYNIDSEYMSIIGMQKSFRDNDNETQPLFDQFKFENKLTKIIKPEFDKLLKEFKEWLDNELKESKEKLDTFLK